MVVSTCSSEKQIITWDTTIRYFKAGLHDSGSSVCQLLHSFHLLRGTLLLNMARSCWGARSCVIDTSVYRYCWWVQILDLHLFSIHRPPSRFFIGTNPDDCRLHGVTCSIHGCPFLSLSLMIPGQTWEQLGRWRREAWHKVCQGIEDQHRCDQQITTTSRARTTE